MATWRRQTQLWFHSHNDDGESKYMVGSFLLYKVKKNHWSWAEVLVIFSTDPDLTLRKKYLGLYSSYNPLHILLHTYLSNS